MLHEIPIRGSSEPSQQILKYSVEHSLNPDDRPETDLVKKKTKKKKNLKILQNAEKQHEIMVN